MFLHEYKTNAFAKAVLEIYLNFKLWKKEPLLIPPSMMPLPL